MKKKLIIGVCITLVVISVVGTTIYRNSKPSVKTLNGAQVTKGMIGEEVFASGRLELNDKTEVNAPFTAKVKSVSVKLGDQVQSGQVLFEMDTEDLKKQLDNAKLDLSGAKSNLDDTKTTRERNIADAKSNLDEAQKNLDQAKTLPVADAIKAAQVAYDQAKQMYDKLINTPSGTTQMENSIKKLQTNVNDLQKQINQAIVKAPVAGTIVSLSAIAGSGSSGSSSMSQASLASLSSANGVGGSLVTIASMDNLKARIKVNEIDSTRVKTGQKVTVTCDAVSKDYAGNVDGIAPTAVTSAGARGEETTVEVVVTLDNSSGLKPGYNINAAIKVSENPNSLLIPIEAVADRDGKKVVFVEDNGAAKMREVSIGINGEKQLEVLSGVGEGDKVILNPAPNLKEGDKVKVNG
ncbi:MAG TPA: HlyD family efflux transporter periplasmic adaptor subunit [Candidatus Deferrimicrobium sp.]|nr:HlyD family efflux transporter periplasmic adaptor subunit [Candidatus Deferrimicrobium sp.]